MKVPLSNWKSCGPCLPYSNRSFMEVRCISFWGEFIWAIDLMLLSRLYFQSQIIIFDVLLRFGQNKIYFRGKCNKFILAFRFGCASLFFYKHMFLFLFITWIKLCMSLDVSFCVCHIAFWKMWSCVHVCLCSCICNGSQRSNTRKCQVICLTQVTTFHCWFQCNVALLEWERIWKMWLSLEQLNDIKEVRFRREACNSNGRWACTCSRFVINSIV